MSNKIVSIRDGITISVATLLAQLAERSNIEGLVVVARFNGRWETGWAGDISSASLCMASMKLNSDVARDCLHDIDASLSLPTPPLPVA